MKNLLIVLAAVFAAGIMSAGAQQLSMERTEHEFGQVRESGGAVSTVFEFTNAGEAPLVVTRAVTTCTCTKIKFTKKPVAPGGKGTIEVTYDPKRQQTGTFFKTIQVFSNDPGKRAILSLKGEVVN